MFIAMIDFTLFRFTINERIKLSGLVTAIDLVLTIVISSLLFFFQVEELYVNNAETVTSLNIKKGILGLMQYQSKAIDQMEVGKI